jgi:hypothetical protein
VLDRLTLRFKVSNALVMWADSTGTPFRGARSRGLRQGIRVPPYGAVETAKPGSMGRNMIAGFDSGILADSPRRVGTGDVQFGKQTEDDDKTLL